MLGRQLEDPDLATSLDDWADGLSWQGVVLLRQGHHTLQYEAVIGGRPLARGNVG